MSTGYQVCICSSDVWYCFLVCGCDCMQHVPCKVFSLSGHPTRRETLRTGHTDWSSQINAVHCCANCIDWLCFSNVVSVKDWCMSATIY